MFKYRPAVDLTIQGDKSDHPKSQLYQTTRKTLSNNSFMLNLKHALAILETLSCDGQIDH